MAKELQADYFTAKTVYFLLRGPTGQIWNGSAFESYLTADYATYKIAAAEQGTASGYYAADFPAANTTPGVYSLSAKEQAGGAAAETDLSFADGDLWWGGAAVGLPTGLSKNRALPNMEFFMADGADHVTGKTGLTVTAQRSIDGGAFAACTSSPSEVGAGVYLIDLSAADLNGSVITFKMTGSGADATVFTLVPSP